MMSCGTSSRYGSSLLLKTADFSIQGVRGLTCVSRKTPSPKRRGSIAARLLRGLFKRPQHGIATAHGSVERLLGGLLPRKCCFHFLGPDVAHLHHVAKAQAARILGRLLVGQLLERGFQGRGLFVEAGRF